MLAQDRLQGWSALRHSGGGGWRAHSSCPGCRWACRGGTGGCKAVQGCRQILQHALQMLRSTGERTVSPGWAA